MFGIKGNLTNQYFSSELYEKNIENQYSYIENHYTMLLAGFILQIVSIQKYTLAEIRSAINCHFQYRYRTDLEPKYSVDLDLFV